ncbi:MAG: hypothetical protein JWP97_2874 [Labilithrix sp.]|nr:hypothetical protein [Labilithrix sp.]
MAIEGSKRASVVQVIKEAASTLRDAKSEPTDDAAVGEALRAACGKRGISPEEFDAAVRDEPELLLLQKNAIREALAGSTDPGPHAEISREAATGRPGDTADGPGNPESSVEPH